MKRLYQGVVLGSATAVAVVAATAALAGTGVGGLFNLGQSNTVNAPSSLYGTTAGKQLVVANFGTVSSSGALLGYGKGSSPAATFQNAGGGPALSLLAGTGQPPFTTNSAYRVANLNADRLDGVDSTQLLRGNGGSYSSRKDIATPDVGIEHHDSLLTVPGLATISGGCEQLANGDESGSFSIDVPSGVRVTDAFAGNGPGRGGGAPRRGVSQV